MTHPKPLSITVLAQLYAQGMTQKEIGQHFGVSQTTIQKRMVEAGIPRRRPGAWRMSKPGLYTTPAQRQQIADQYASGDSGQTVADAHGVTISTVYRAARAHGVPVRGRAHYTDASSSGYRAAVQAVAQELKLDPARLRQLLVTHGLSAFVQPATENRTPSA